MTQELSGPSDPLEAIADEFVARLRRGERPTVAEYTVRYAGLAARIVELFPALELIERLKPRRDEPAGATVEFQTGPHQDVTAQPVRSLGEYNIMREIGHGGMGIVYEAEHRSLKNRVALKVMHPRFRTDSTYLRRFQTEARSAAQLHHTNIVPVFDYGGMTTSITTRCNTSPDSA